MDFLVEKQWDGQSTGHGPVKITLNAVAQGVIVNIDAPFFNDPPNPGGPPGQPFQKLGDYEGSVNQFASKSKCVSWIQT